MADTRGVYVVANGQQNDATKGDSGITAVTYKAVTLVAGTSDDIVTITKGTLDYTVNSGDGNDTIYGAAKTENAMDGGAGNDWLQGGTLRDIIIGGTGNDTIYAGNGDDKIDGGADSDYVSGGYGNDIVDGCTGNDYVVGGAGTDILTGGEGKDVFIYRLDAQKSLIDWSEWGTDTITDFKTGTDRIEMDQFFMRLADPDVKKILAGIDRAVKLTNDKYELVNQWNDAGKKPAFSHGSDAVDTDSDADAVELLYKVNGLDNYTYEIGVNTTLNNNTGKVSLTLSFETLDKKNNVIGETASITFTDVNDLSALDFTRENLKLIHGTAASNIIDISKGNYLTALGDKGGLVFGFDGRDAITGGLKTDSLFGGKGGDTIRGGGGGDYLRGEGDIDFLYGDAGNDDIRGGDGHDLIKGGTGRDVIYGNAGVNTLFGGDGNPKGDCAKDIFAVAGSSVSGQGLTYDKAGHPIYNLEGGRNFIMDFEVGLDKIQLGNLFSSFRITKVEEQNRKFAEFLEDHIEHHAGSNDVTIYTGTVGDANNAFVIRTGSDAAATAIYNDMHTNHNYSTYFVFG